MGQTSNLFFFVAFFKSFFYSVTYKTFLMCLYPDYSVALLCNMAIFVIQASQLPKLWPVQSS